MITSDSKLVHVYTVWLPSDKCQRVILHKRKACSLALALWLEFSECFLIAVAVSVTEEGRKAGKEAALQKSPFSHVERH